MSLFTVQGMHHWEMIERDLKWADYRSSWKKIDLLYDEQWLVGQLAVFVGLFFL